LNKNIEEFYEHIALSPWILLAWIPSTFFSYYWILPLVIDLQTIILVKLDPIINFIINLALTTLEKIDLTLKGCIAIVERKAADLKEVLNLKTKVRLYSIVKPKFTTNNYSLNVNPPKSTAVVTNRWFWGFEGYRLFPSVKISDDWKIIPNKEKGVIFGVIDNKALNNNNTSLEAVRLENGRPKKLTAKGLTKTLTYSHPLSYTIYTAVETDKGSFAPINLEDMLQLNSPKGGYYNTDALLQWTAPPKAGYNPTVYMQSTKDDSTQGGYYIDSDTGEPSNLNKGKKKGVGK
jgi:hypothetical protein